MDRPLLMALVKGAATYVPVLNHLSNRRTGGTVSARYCYSVWLRHLVLALENGLRDIPSVVAELGPGDSLGTGLAALLCGAERLHALDVEHYANPRRNLLILEELVRLFEARAPIPGEDEFPEIKPRLRDHAFPRGVLTDERLRASLAPERVAAVRDALDPPPGALTGSIRIAYCVPWAAGAVIEAGAVEFIYSQAVLEHVTDLDQAYAALHRWLKPGGFMSHQIDFRSHGLARHWNGHWGYSDAIWGLIRGRKSYLLNREACSGHLARLAGHGFTLAGAIRVESAAGIPRARLAPRFHHYTDEDLRTSGALLQSMRPA